MDENENLPPESLREAYLILGKMDSTQPSTTEIGKRLGVIEDKDMISKAGIASFVIGIGIPIAGLILVNPSDLDLIPYLYFLLVNLVFAILGIYLGYSGAKTSILNLGKALAKLGMILNVFHLGIIYFAFRGAISL